MEPWWWLWRWWERWFKREAKETPTIKSMANPAKQEHRLKMWICSRLHVVVLVSVAAAGGGGAFTLVSRDADSLVG